LGKETRYSTARQVRFIPRPLARYQQALLPDSLGDFPMLAAFIRFLEELIDVANFGRDVSK